jgi:hypothetical protein
MSHHAYQRKPLAWREVFRRSAFDALFLGGIAFLYIRFWSYRASIFASHKLAVAGLVAVSLACLVLFKEAFALWLSGVLSGRGQRPASFARIIANVSAAMIYLVIVWLICRK